MGSEFSTIESTNHRLERHQPGRGIAVVKGSELETVPGCVILGKSSDLSELISLIMKNKKSYFSGLWQVYDVKCIYRLLLKVS